MKYYVQQKFWSFIDRFKIYDENENIVYTVEGEFSFAKKFHVYDAYDQEVAYIAQKFWSFLSRFDIYVNGNNVGQIVKDLTLFKPSYHIEGSTWTIEGDFWAHDYEIYNGNELVADINRKWLTLADQYEIVANDEYDPIMVVATVLAIDACLQAAAAAANSSAH